MLDKIAKWTIMTVSFIAASILMMGLFFYLAMKEVKYAWDMRNREDKQDG